MSNENSNTKGTDPKNVILTYQEIESFLNENKKFNNEKLWKQVDIFYKFMHSMQEKYKFSFDESNCYICFEPVIQIYSKTDNEQILLDAYILTVVNNIVYILLFEIKTNNQHDIEFYNMLIQFKEIKNITKQNNNLVWYLFPFFKPNKYEIIKIDIIETTSKLSTSLRKYKRSTKDDFSINKIYENNWEEISEGNFIEIFKNGKFINLYDDNDINDILRDSIMLEDILDIFKRDNNDTINRILLTNKNISSFINKIINDKNSWNNRKIIVITGVPGSGKTVLSLLLYKSLKKCLLWILNGDIVQRCNNDNDFNKTTKDNENLLENFVSIGNNTTRNWETILDNKNNFKYVIIDEFQRIKLCDLKQIIDKCIKKDIKLFLFGDYKQDINAFFDKDNEKDCSHKNTKEELVTQYIKSKLNKGQYYFNKKENKKENWGQTNRFSELDQDIINYIITGSKDSLRNIRENTNCAFKLKRNEKIPRYINIKLMNNKDIEKLDENSIKIFYLSLKNIKDVNTQYDAIGHQYDDILIRMSSHFKIINRKCDTKLKQFFGCDEFKEGLSDKNVDAVEKWLYTVFTRATKSIKIYAEDPDVYNVLEQRIKDIDGYK